MHGNRDNMVPFNQSELLYEALKTAGVDATFHPVKGAGHGKKARPGPARRPRAPFRLVRTRRAIARLAAHPYDRTPTVPSIPPYGISA
ncbi:MAG: alpha/beta hydrolase family protein [Isosphaeraceae bacterium]